MQKWQSRGTASPIKRMGTLCTLGWNLGSSFSGKSFPPCVIQSSPDPLVGFKGPTSKGKGGKRGEGKEREGREKGGEEKGRTRHGAPPTTDSLRCLRIYDLKK